MPNETDSEIEAFDSKELAAVLVADRELMALYKAAADEGRIRAVRVGQRNFTVVEHAEVLRGIRRASPSPRPYPVRADTGDVDISG